MSDLAHLNRMAAWLYRPLLDLGDMPACPPLATNTVELAYRRLAETADVPELTACATGELRREIVRAVGRPEYDVADPRLVPADLQTARWRNLCDHLDRWHDLAPRTQLRVLDLLGRLGFLPLTRDLLSGLDLDGASPHQFDLRMARAMNDYLMWCDDHTTGSNLPEFADIASHAPPGISKLNACYQLVRRAARESGDLEMCEAWQPRHFAALRELEDVLSEFDYGRYLSRYHRVGAFLPQMRRDGDGTAAEMALAESLARSLPRDTWEQRVAADEVLYAALESRSKEALWLGDAERALGHATELVRMQPAMSRSWFHQADILFGLDRIKEARDAYRRALRYSPPGAARALYSIGQCEEILGDAEAATDSYVAALGHDPLGIGVAKQLVTMRDQLTSDCCSEYARHVLDPLMHLRKATPDRAGMGTAHQRMPAPAQLPY
jgi:tetratricopeptide (TPR) repeat protein